MTFTPPRGLRMIVAGHISEKDLARYITEMCEVVGVIRYHHLNSIGTERGFPDETWIGAHGMCFVELKSQKGRIRPEQQTFLDAVEATGAGRPALYVFRPEDWLSGEIQKVIQALGRNPLAKEHYARIAARRSAKKTLRTSVPGRKKGNRP